MIKELTRRDMLKLSSLLATGLCTTNSFGSSYPEKNIELIVPFPPAGSVDPLARILSANIERNINKSIIIDNKGGAFGNIGASYVAKSKNNSHRIFWGTDGILAINPHLYKNPGFDPFKDFTPVSLICRGANAITVRADSPIKNLNDLFDAARREPGGLFYGSIAGTSQHLTGINLEKESGAKFSLIPYKGGAPTVVDLIGGSLPCAIGSYAMMKPHVESGKVRVLAVSSKERLSVAPKIPTVSETFPGFEQSFWYGIFLPSGVKPEIVSFVEKLFVNTVSDELIKKSMIDMALTPIGGSAELMKNVLRSDFDKFGQLIKNNNIKIELI